MKNGFITIGLILSMGIVSPFAATGFVKIQGGHHTYNNIETIPTKDTALVLGAAAYPNRLSDILKDRVDTAIELYQAGKVQKLVMSGGEWEAKDMKTYAIQQGVPAEHIIEDPWGLNTLASIENIAKEEKAITIVSQEYHLPRALFMADSFGMDAVGMSADKQIYLNMDDYQKREFLAINKAIVDLFFGDTRNIFKTFE